MSQEEFSDDVRRFILKETKKRVAYLMKYIRSQGRPIDEEQLANFEEEIRAQEENLGKSHTTSIG